MSYYVHTLLIAPKAAFRNHPIPECPISPSPGYYFNGGTATYEVEARAEPASIVVEADVKGLEKAS